MAIKAITLGETWDFYSSFDTAKGDARTKFVLGPVDSRVLAVLKDKATKITGDANNPEAEIGLAYNTHEFNFQVAQFGLKGVDNLLDAKDEIINYETQRRNIGGKSYEIASQTLLERIPSDIVAEIAQDILDKNILNADEGKGSGEQS